VAIKLIGHLTKEVLASERPARVRTGTQRFVGLVGKLVEKRPPIDVWLQSPPIHVEEAAFVVTCDVGGRRVQRTPGNSTTWYVYDAMGQLAAEFDSSQSGSNLTTQFITTDHLGSTRAVADASGNLTDCHDYLPFGEEILAATGNRPSCYTTGTNDQIAQKFTGDERDPETQEDFFQARYFAAPEGRFRSIDPIGIPDDVGDPQQWNKYSYTRNNPLLFTDPTGEKCVWTNSKWVDDGKGGGCDTSPRFRVEALPETFSGQSRDRLIGGVKGLGMNPLEFFRMLGAPDAGHPPSLSADGGSWFNVRGFATGWAAGACA
jgi:RHS repeat-associated protein